MANQAAEHLHTDTQAEIPELGQVVSVRGSTWAVTDVREQSAPAAPGSGPPPRTTQVVGLQSLSEDQLGSELRVVWEIEVGHGLLQAHGLRESLNPETFDDPNRLAAFVDAVRWGTVTSARSDAYQSPFRSGVNIEAYQLEPLRRALNSSRTNLLLSDDVGLGKTVEAGLVVQELLLRQRAKSVIVVCPPSLRLKWQDEMRDKFGLDFTIVDSALMARIRRSHGLAANPFRLFPRVIVSMPWLPTIRAQRLLREVYADTRADEDGRRYAFDALVVDEAHHVAPASPNSVAGARGYAVDSQRTTATRALAERCEHRLFLSATPHNGYSESFTALLEMIDDRRFARGADLDENALAEVAVRRLKTQIKEKDFKPRRLESIHFDPTADEQEHFAELERILTASARRNGKGRAGDIMSMLLKKRFLSSPWSFALTLQQFADGSPAGRFDENRDYFQDVLGSGQADEEEGEADHPEAETLRAGKASAPLSAASKAEIDSLVQWGRGFQHRPDSKLSALIGYLDDVCRPDGKRWTDERAVVFSEYAATVDWIKGNLEQAGFGDRLAVIQGSTPHEDREQIRARFSARPEKDRVRVLLATDSAGEGIDLQAHCHRLVNYDIPFNPSRLEQRIGRIDRYGQPHTPEIRQFRPVQTSTTYAADADFMGRIAEKVGTVAADLGSVNQVADIDAEVEGHFASTPNRKRARVAPEIGSEVIGRALAGSAELNRELARLSDDHERTRAAMHWTSANARRVIDTAFELSGQPALIPVEDHSGGEATDVDGLFRIPRLDASWQPTLVGLATRLDPDNPRPITFDGKIAAARPDVVHLHLGHAVMQRATRFLRAELFGGDSLLHRVTATVVEGLDESCVAAMGRLVLVGRGGLRLHEEVFLTGLRLNGRPLAQARTEQALDQALDRERMRLAEPAVLAALAENWNAEDSRLRTRLLDAMEVKARKRREQVQADLGKRKGADLDRSEEIFKAFRANLNDSVGRLGRALKEQSEALFGVDHRGEADLDREQEKQLRADLRAMEDRLHDLDRQKDLERAAIEARYTDVRPHLTGAAVIFALTPEYAERSKARR
ncbi:DISARM system SNF2-like helicase DrmD [Glycomyces harbinensis]|uniref:SNF2 family N-terminal domain-containing protein n=1 Tax=Glycomyces harbinensis TaxID=58114 RepID=A0A1G7B0B4_9ACTN|nr:DISARM system SNF2-like helicase DrmD [Glycomyces harbinensis]SDE20287.1 SNF2 family N-terminal domain-containing protein [Glycomyces harbinensis]